MKCPVCTEPMEETNRLGAHDKVVLVCYCAKCDVNADIAIDPSKLTPMSD